MLDFEQYRNRISESSRDIKNELRVLSSIIRGRWYLGSLTLAFGLLAGACAVGNNEGSYDLEEVGGHLEDKKLDPGGKIRSVSFWMDNDFTVDGSNSGSLALDVCANGKATVQLVSEQVSGEPGPGLLFAGHYDLNNNCTSDVAKIKPIHPVTDVNKLEVDKIYIGTNDLKDLREYNVSRVAEAIREVDVKFTRVTSLQEPLISRNGSRLTP